MQLYLPLQESCTTVTSIATITSITTITSVATIASATNTTYAANAVGKAPHPHLWRFLGSVCSSRRRTSSHVEAPSCREDERFEHGRFRKHCL